MRYEDYLMEAFTNVINTISKLSMQEQNFIKKNLRFITNHINKQEVKNKNLIEKASGVEKDSYDDSLEYFSCLLMLHGYNEADLNCSKFDKFTAWFVKHALTNTAYISERINKFILTAFLDGYRLFCIEYTREPENYLELKQFVLNWDDIIKDKDRKEIEKLTTLIKSVNES